MCNFYNVGTRNTSIGCGMNYGGWNSNGQRMCRDSNGNVWMRIATNDCGYCGSCCYHNCCGCNHGCGNNGGGNTSGSQNDTTNGGYGCVTLCGVSLHATAQQTTNDTTTTTRRCGCNRCARNYNGCYY